MMGVFPVQVGSRLKGKNDVMTFLLMKMRLAVFI